MKNIKYKKRLTVLIAGYLSFASFVNAENSYSPYAGQNDPTNVYWGDTHLHTNLSKDAYVNGNRLGPDEAYRFAKGETVTTSNGLKAHLRRPLDFLVIADHGINMGLLNAVEAKNQSILKTKLGERWATWLNKREEIGQAKSSKMLRELSSEMLVNGHVGDDQFRHSLWQDVTALADWHNDPGRFTALIGYEWTSIVYNLHRVVIFQDSADKAGRIIPFTQFDSPDPEKLWSFFEGYTRETGGDVLAIPHNGNLSMGVMFALQDAKGNRFSKQYANTRSRWEPLYEVTQIKGDGEAHPILSPTDEFADYETWDVVIKAAVEGRGKYGKLVNYTDYERWRDDKNDGQLNTDWQRTYEYARSALKLGLKEQARLRVNPFKFGMIGSTDSHTSLATADENNFWGKMASDEPHNNRMDRSTSYGWRMNAAGYAAVWAEENTREALFSAMKRKEVYASTGPRMTVRFFGGWSYDKDDAFKPDLANIGYTKGVPMGGDLTNAPKGEVPSFLIRAVKDPDGANLDRIQVIKGWHDKHGTLHEKIYNVALSDGRKKNRKGKIKPVGSTVEVKSASYINSIGDAELAVVWKDPDFNKNELAFYYVRVLEIPTPRWTAYDAKYFGIRDIPEEVPMVTQERAYTSPIWYSPAGE